MTNYDLNDLINEYMLTNDELNKKKDDKKKADRKTIIGYKKETENPIDYLKTYHETVFEDPAKNMPFIIIHVPIQNIKHCKLRYYYKNEIKDKLISDIDLKNNMVIKLFLG